ncbi:Kynurenine formamidase [Tulasnella sp. 424]|nr:Kynurenine formamidase [Tulasnella sp. 424]KAG8978468.1 Kynurenine formamidase [Tulasnella sp. 425]
MTTSSESLASAADATVEELRYGDGPNNTLDLYTASQSGGIENAASTRNLIVYVHGGAWRSGDKSEHKDLASKLVAASPSLEVAVVNYVISPRKAEDGPAVRHPAHAADVLRALHWLVDPPVDEDQGTRSSSLRPKPNLWLVGHSCGAHILSSIFLQSPETSSSASLVPSPDLIQSVKGILLAEGIYHIDLLLRLHPTYNDFIEGAFTARDSYADVSTPEFTAREGTSHIKWFVVQSTGDSLVTEEDSVVMYEALAKLYPGTNNVSKDFSTMTEDHDEMLQTDAFKDLLLRFLDLNEPKEILSEDELPPVASMKEAVAAALLPNSTNLLS